MEKLIFFLSIFTWIAITAFIFPKASASGEKMIGAGWILLISSGILLLMLAVLSYIMFQHGLFQWIDQADGVRKILMVCGFLAAAYALVSSIMIRLEWGSYSEENTKGLVAMILYYSIIWLPLLIFIPYGYILFVVKQGESVPVIFRTMLIVLSVIGFVSWLKIQSVKYSVPRQSDQTGQSPYYQRDLGMIQSSHSVDELLQFALNHDNLELRKISLDKIRTLPDRDEQLIAMLNDCPKGYNYTSPILYLNDYPTLERAVFVKALNNVLECMSSKVHEIMQDPERTSDALEALPIIKMVKLLSSQYQYYREDFEENMQILKSELEANPKGRFEDLRKDYVSLIDQWMVEK